MKRDEVSESIWKQQ